MHHYCLVSSSTPLKKAGAFLSVLCASSLFFKGGSCAAAEPLFLEVADESPQALTTSIFQEDSDELLIDELLIDELLIVSNSLPEQPSVSQLSDVEYDSWAHATLLDIIERYELEIGVPDSLNQEITLSRNEFAAILSSLLQQIPAYLAEISSEDLAALERLRSEFSQDIAQVEREMDLSSLESSIQQIEDNQFSPVGYLSGQVLMAATAGGFTGDSIIAPEGAVVTEDNPDPFFLSRVSIFFNVAFNSKDYLQLRITSGSNGPNDNVAGSVEPNLGSTLDYGTQGRDNNFALSRAYYQFSPAQDLQVVIAPLGSITDFIDKNRYASSSTKDFSTQALANNFVLLPTSFGRSAVLDWNPGGGDLSLRAAYVTASKSAVSIGENSGLVTVGGSADVQLFPPVGGSEQRSLFGDPRQGFVELEYAPSDAIALRLQYAGGKIFGSDFDGVGINAELAPSSKFALFGRYGYARYTNTSVGDISPQYWMAGATYSGAFKEYDLIGVAATQPLIESKVGNATQTIIESFYNLPITDRLSVTPFTQVVVNPANQSSNGTIIVGGMRATFSF